MTAASAVIVTGRDRDSEGLNLLCRAIGRARGAAIKSSSSPANPRGTVFTVSSAYDLEMLEQRWTMATKHRQWVRNNLDCHVSGVLRLVEDTSLAGGDRRAAIRGRLDSLVKIAVRDQLRGHCWCRRSRR